MTIDFVGTQSSEQRARKRKEQSRKALTFFGALSALVIIVGGLIFWFAPEPKNTTTIVFEGKVDFTDGRNESRKMIDFIFTNPQRIAFPEKERVEWSDSEFRVEVEVPKETGATAFAASVDHPGYQNLLIDSVEVVGGRVKFPAVSLERKWKTGKRPGRAKPKPQAPDTSIDGGEANRGAVEAGRLKRRR